MGTQVATGRALPRVERRMWFILAVPACTDMLGTVLNMIGLLYVTVSVYQLLRCFVIVFVAVLKVRPLSLRVCACPLLLVQRRFVPLCVHSVNHVSLFRVRWIRPSS